MNGYNFTDRVRKVLQMAREEAARLHHEYVGTEHILLGLIREGEGVAAAVLQNLNVDLEEIQQKIEETVKKGKAAAATGPDLPYTSRAKKVLELAMTAAISSDSTRLSRRESGQSPLAMSCASPSTMAVLPTPGSPISTGLFFFRRVSTSITRSISFARPIVGSSWPSAASCVRSRQKWSRAGVLDFFSPFGADGCG